MASVFDWIDTTPILDLAFLALFIAGIAVLLFWAAWTVHRERQYRIKRDRLIQLHAEGDPLSCPGRKQTRTRTQRHLTTPPVTGAASPSRDDFTEDHSFNDKPRPRVGK